jgi:hypothetical protein
MGHNPRELFAKERQINQALASRLCIVEKVVGRMPDIIHSPSVSIKESKDRICPNLAKLQTLSPL